MDEQETPRRQSLLRQDRQVVTWWGSSVECASALHRLHRQGELDAAGLAQAGERFETLAGTWFEIEPSGRLRRRALRLLRVHPLRAADALQLAAALVAADEDPPSLDVVSSDVRLSDAAFREGFTVR
ncbi:MAG: PIN domain-containing protein [Acidobacteria bacterium]|nr:PIN domain-containing protein [Acidobacteriota bacterium]